MWGIKKPRRETKNLRGFDFNRDGRLLPFHKKEKRKRRGGGGEAETGRTASAAGRGAHILRRVIYRRRGNLRHAWLRCIWTWLNVRRSRGNLRFFGDFQSFRHSYSANGRASVFRQSCDMYKTFRQCRDDAPAVDDCGGFVVACPGYWGVALFAVFVNGLQFSASRRRSCRPTVAQRG